MVLLHGRCLFFIHQPPDLPLPAVDGHALVVGIVCRAGKGAQAGSLRIDVLYQVVHQIAVQAVGQLHQETLKQQVDVFGVASNVVLVAAVGRQPGVVVRLAAGVWALQLLQQGRHPLDLLVVADVEEEGLMSHSRVYANGELIHEAIYISSDEAEEFLQLSNALMPYLKNSDTIIIPVDIPRTVSLSIDGEAVSPVNGYIALEKGEHEFSYGSPVYHAAKETVQVDENTVLEPVLVPIFSGPMFIHSVPYDADIYYQGVKVDNHIAGNGSVPFTVTAIRDGFAPYSVQSTVAPYSRVNIELRPAWMGENDMIERSKDRFYSLLLSTLVSFGLQVAANSVSDIFPDWGIAPVGAVFAGISIVQLVELFDSAFDYFQAAKLGM